MCRELQSIYCCNTSELSSYIFVLGIKEYKNIYIFYIFECFLHFCACDKSSESFLHWSSPTVIVSVRTQLLHIQEKGPGDKQWEGLHVKFT